ncbi:MAG: hypothetical protein MUP81_01385 [Dehalococcoidia bacterium]|nr:hypothetical protein [Dehalococcoidia bacterium]
MKFNAILRIATTVIIPIEAEDGGEAEEFIRRGDYKCPDFNDQVLDNLEEADAEIEIEAETGD